MHCAFCYLLKVEGGGVRRSDHFDNLIFDCAQEKPPQIAAVQPPPAPEAMAAPAQPLQIVAVQPPPTPEAKAPPPEKARPPLPAAPPAPPPEKAQPPMQQPMGPKVASATT